MVETTNTLDMQWLVPPVMQTAPLSQLNKNASAVSEQMAEGPVQVMKNSDVFGVLVSSEHWNRIARELENLRLLAESRWISAKNDREGTWIDEDEMNRRMVERGVFTQEEMDELERRREPEHVTVAN